MISLKVLFPMLSISDNYCIDNLQNDSRFVDENTLFIACTGFEIDIHNYIGDAYKQGCRFFLIDSKRKQELISQYPNALFIESDNLKTEMVRVALEFYNYPDSKLTLIGVTGTNGKTTTATVINQSLKLMGQKTAFFGTIEWSVGDNIYPALNTTPDFLTLIKYLKQAVDQNISYVVMEVASHALSLGRVEGLNFDCAIFTNLTQDHLDFHSTLEDYYKAKESFFTDILVKSNKKHKKAFINADDIYGQRLLKLLGETGIPANSLSIEGHGVWNAQDIKLSIYKTIYQLVSVFYSKSITIETHLLGLINVQNTMTAYTVLDHLGYIADEIAVAISKINVPGRLEKIEDKNGIVFLVDYAHTPDALEKAITVVNDVLENKKNIVVFGAGGDRDRKKRPLMAQATKNAHIVIVTSDNPRTEDPEQIIKDIMLGFEDTSNVYQEIDRSKAIELAYKQAQSGDVILIAGKGHENYQIIGTTKNHFSDIEEIYKCINQV